MSETTTSPEKINIIRTFAPGWFASVMGTAVMVIAVFVFRKYVPMADALQLFFLALSLLMMVVFLVPWTLRWLLYFDDAKQELHHPVTSAFYPTMPISLIIWGIALEKAGPLFLSHETILPILQGLWIAGTVGITIFAFIILRIHFLEGYAQWKSANLGWLIPPVSALIVPLLGMSLAVEYAGTAMGDTNFIISLIFLGVGSFLFLFVMGAVFTRYIFHDLLPAHLAPTAWIGVAPTAILSVIMVKMVKPTMLFFDAPAEVGAVLGVLSKITAVSLWGFAFFWLLFVVTLTAGHHKKVAIPYAMSWWAFAFPLGSFVVATGVMFGAMGSAFFLWVGLIALAVFGVVWLIVAVRTAKATISREIFA